MKESKTARQQGQHDSAARETSGVRGETEAKRANKKQRQRKATAAINAMGHDDRGYETEETECKRRAGTFRAANDGNEKGQGKRKRNGTPRKVDKDIS